MVTILFLVYYLQYKYMGIELHLGDEILELVSPRELMDGPKFSIKAAKAGMTSLYVSWH
jgi:nuclear pore complex protein Nup210